MQAIRPIQMTQHPHQALRFGCEQCGGKNKDKQGDMGDMKEGQAHQGWQDALAHHKECVATAGGVLLGLALLGAWWLRRRGKAKPSSD